MSFAFGVVRQWFEPVLIEAGPTQIDALFPGAAGLARPMLTGAGGDAPSGDDYGVLHGLYWMLATLAQQAAILLFVDDAHWADDTHGTGTDGRHAHRSPDSRRPTRPPSDDAAHGKIGMHAETHMHQDAIVAWWLRS